MCALTLANSALANSGDNSISPQGQHAENAASSLVASKSEVIESLVAMGNAKLSVFVWDVYQSQLFTESGIFDESFDQTIALEIEYLRDIDAEDLVDATKKEWLHLGYQQDDYQAWLTAISDLWPNITEGDKLTCVLTGSKTTDFYFNDQHLGTISDPTFGKGFLSIWLDENTSRPELRAQLINPASTSKKDS